MKTYLLAALLLTGTVVQSQMPMLTAAEKADGWKLMFDGKSLAGWRGYKDEKAPGGWRAENGLLIRLAGGGDLMTVEQYSDFEMRFEWKITEYGNSGVIYRIATTEPYPWHTRGGIVTEGVLRALNIPFEYARDPKEAGRQIREAYTFSQSSLSPVALLLTRDLMEEAL